MANAIDRDLPVLVTDAGGTKRWSGCVILHNELVVTAAVAFGSTATIGAGRGAAFEATSTFSDWGASTTADPAANLVKVTVPAVGRKGYLGVALHNAPAGGELKIAGIGSIVSAYIATGAGAALGDFVGDGNAGQQLVTVGGAAYGTILGTVLIPRASTSYGVILVNPR